MKTNLKTISKVVIAVAITVFALSPGTVWAQSEDNSQVEQDSQSADKKAERDARLEERKAARQERLTTAQTNRITARCKASQTILGNYSRQVQQRGERRTQIHDRVVDRLNNAVAKVGDQADTQALQASITELKAKVDAFNTNLISYQQTISDLVEVDCVADPEAFQDSLVTAREERRTIVEEAKAVRAYIRDNIKPLIVALKQELEA